MLNRRYVGLPSAIGVMGIASGLSLLNMASDALGFHALYTLEQSLVESIDFSELLMQGMPFPLGPDVGDSAAPDLILAPILFPIAMKLGIDPTHLGIIMVVNLEIGLIIPPVGLNLFVTSAVTGMSVPATIRCSCYCSWC